MIGTADPRSKAVTPRPQDDSHVTCGACLSGISDGKPLSKAQFPLKHVTVLIGNVDILFKGA